MSAELITRCQPTCLLSHDILNRLSVIIGSCDLVLAVTEDAGGIGGEARRRVMVVREMSWDMVKDLREHTCQLGIASRTEMLKLDAEKAANTRSASKPEPMALDRRRNQQKAHGPTD